MTIDAAIQRYYSADFDEGSRLTTRTTAGKIEFLRTRELIERQLEPGRKLHIADIGGGTGVHATWLAEAGHLVRLLDPVPDQVERATRVGTFQAVVGDARHLPWPDDHFDLTLILGPLYHLASAQDRHLALAEAVRVTRPGGVLFAAAIPRFVAFGAAWLGEEPPSPLPAALAKLLEAGSFQFDHVAFPGAHFHTAEELITELATAGLTDITCEGVEGPAGPALEVRGTHDDDLLDPALTIARRVGPIPGVRDLSNHLLAWGRVPPLDRPI
ncbi:class I SAM-dependent methyltransferase [Microlunatus speluncae]|uniref:class I SAM-dependent methyltransferase n=1 Tax=Microlunatus speluncae TaxID=2594267 RepID=UPI001375CDA7|nr:class I SAM-dependent methyltransferase [Microlunatus speluncae]